MGWVVGSVLALVVVVAFDGLAGVDGLVSCLLGYFGYFFAS